MSEESSRSERRSRRERGASWIAGLVLIVVGIAFLLSNLSGVEFNNWWALFILIPAVGGFSRGWRRYQEEGRITSGVWSSFAWSAVLVIVALIFLFNLNWDIMLAVVLLLGGLGLLVTGFFRAR